LKVSFRQYSVVKKHLAETYGWITLADLLTVKLISYKHGNMTSPVAKNT